MCSYVPNIWCPLHDCRMLQWKIFWHLDPEWMREQGIFTNVYGIWVGWGVCTCTWWGPKQLSTICVACSCTPCLHVHTCQFTSTKNSWVTYSCTLCPSSTRDTGVHTSNLKSQIRAYMCIYIKSQIRGWLNMLYTYKKISIFIKDGNSSTTLKSSLRVCDIQVLQHAP